MSNRIFLTLATLAALCSAGHAESPPPPLGENLVLDCTFNDPIESTPWQAESGALAEMLCPAGGCGHCPEQVNMLRFKGRDTDDVLAVSQQLDLPAASSYDLSFDLKYCDTRPTGTVSFSLGNFEAYTITIPTRPTSGVRNYAHSFDNSGESPVQPAGLAELVIGNPALDGNDIMVDNVRIVPRFSGSLCTLDSALNGYWRRKVNGGEASQDSWFFSENGTFYLDAQRGYWDEENGECCISGTTYEGSWCVDNSQSPPGIYLRVDSEGIYESKSAKAEKVFEPDCGAPERAWYGRYQIDGGQLSLRVQECPNPTFDSPPVFLKDGFASDNGTLLIAPCDTPEGEGTVEAETTEAENTEGEGEGTVETCPATPTADSAVVGNWGQKCVVYDGALQFGEGQEWSFNADGTFTLQTTQYGDEWITGTSLGTYTVNTSVSPAQMDLHTCETCFDDVFDEYEECDYCCFPRDYNQQAIYSIEGDILSIAKGNSRPATLSIDNQHKRDEYEYCPTNELSCDNGEGNAALAAQSWSASYCSPFSSTFDGTWEFGLDGSVYHSYLEGDEGPMHGLNGQYRVNTSVTPHEIEIQFCNECVTTFEEGELKSVKSTVCDTVDVQLAGFFQIEGDFLLIATGEEMPTSLEEARLYSTGTECPTNEFDICPEPTAGGDANLLDGAFLSLCDGLKSWTFFPDGRFEYAHDFPLEPNTLTESGIYSVNTSVTPHTIDLHYCLSCVNGESCILRDRDKLGVYRVVDGVFSISLGDTRPANLGDASHFALSWEGECPSPSEGELPFEGEGESEGCKSNKCDGEFIEEGEGASASGLAGTWGRGVCDKDLELPKHEWSFEEDGDFVEVVIAVNAGWVDRYSGTYTVNLSTSPAQVDLHYTLKETYDDVELEEGEACDCGGDCFIDSCEVLDFTDLGVFEIVGTTLNLATGDCRPESTTGALEHERDGTFCVSEEALGDFSPAPGECSEEGEGEGEGAEGEGEGEGEGDPCKGDKSEACLDFGAYEAIQYFTAFDNNNDNQLNVDEAASLGVRNETFALLDLNGDGQLSPAELLYGAGADSPRHTADTDFDGALSLSELLRSIQMYNAGGYSCAPQADSEDGYVPQPFEGKGADPGCPPHASDYAPADGVISLSELLRAIQLYNSGGYSPCESGGEDGFCL